ncbi:hypothetical protein [Bacillus sp. TL12]|uniref:hypothetical protein n=1 Tax=Bacillus sp. TL12 TaxID=2894756 RepID=UPI001F51C106|nr:hypothetical protein [Bacillus sp. TL12]MCI0767298.1 hypothetical protein [Bacillus sp. TL12]
MRRIIVIVVLSLGMVVSMGYGWKQKGEVKEYETKYKQVLKENTRLQDRVHAKENNEETKVKKDTEAFLRAFFTYDTSKGEQGWAKIDSYTTETARGKLKPAGEQQKPQKTPPETTIVSNIKDVKLYYTAMNNGEKANVFSRLWINTTVNGITSTSQMVLDIQMVYSAESKKWIVGDISIQQPLGEEGYIN